MDPASWKQAKDVIFEALERPVGERETFVRHRCADPVVCAEVLAVLKDCPTTDDFLASFPPEPELEETDELADLQPGTQVGQYVIVDRLGRGGMGQVFLGSDKELRRKVALKCLLSSRADSDTERVRILREARAAAAINHANVATIHHVIEHGDRAFIVMEYVEGESLAARLKRERLPLDRVIAIGCQLSAALTAAHARGVVHRDLKPANVQLTPDGSAKVLDFGVARLMRSLTPASSGASTAGPSRAPAQAFVGGGTPPYMSPEQLLGRSVDDRSDIYSLGVMLFEMATGRRPHLTHDPLGLIEAQAKGAPRANAVDALVPATLADIIAKALESDPTRRYQSAREVESALEAVERQLQTKGLSVRELILHWLARVAIGVSIVILALGVIGFIATIGFNSTFGRVGAYARFGVEPWTSYFAWGYLAIVPSAVRMTIAAVVVLALGFVLRLAELIGPIGRVMSTMRTRGRTIALAIGLDNPIVLAQALTGLGIITLGGVWWYHSNLINAWASNFNSSRLEALLPMRPQSFERLWYRAELDVMTLMFSFGLYRVLQLRKQQQTHDLSAAVAMLTGLIAVMVLMNQWPYRVLTARDFERVNFAGVFCYIIGESGNEFLILCPGSDPPRNRAIPRDDPGLRRFGIVENVFNGVNLARAAQ